MRKVLFITIALMLAVSNTFALSPVETYSSNSEYSQEVIDNVILMGKLAAEADLCLFNEYSNQLDLFLFDYYMNSYYDRKEELGSTSGGGGGGNPPYDDELID